MNDFLSGTLVVMSVAIGLYQLRFWRKSQDRLFLYFAVAFFLMAINRFALFVVDEESESRTYFYVVRLIAFLLIIWAIVEKNRAARRPPPQG